MIEVTPTVEVENLPVAYGAFYAEGEGGPALVELTVFADCIVVAGDFWDFTLTHFLSVLAARFPAPAAPYHVEAGALSMRATVYVEGDPRDLITVEEAQLWVDEFGDPLPLEPPETEADQEADGAPATETAEASHD